MTEVKSSSWAAEARIGTAKKHRTNRRRATVRNSPRMQRTGTKRRKWKKKKRNVEDRKQIINIRGVFEAKKKKKRL